MRNVCYCFQTTIVIPVDTDDNEVADNQAFLKLQAALAAIGSNIDGTDVELHDIYDDDFESVLED